MLMFKTRRRIFILTRDKIYRPTISILYPQNNCGMRQAFDTAEIIVYVSKHLYIRTITYMAIGVKISSGLSVTEMRNHLLMMIAIIMTWHINFILR